MPKRLFCLRGIPALPRETPEPPLLMVSGIAGEERPGMDARKGKPVGMIYDKAFMPMAEGR